MDFKKQYLRIGGGKLNQTIKEMRVSADLGKIDKMYGGDGPRSTTSKTKVSPKAYNMLSKDVKVLRMAVKQLERSVKTQHQADTHHDLIYLLTRAHEAYKNSKK